MIQIIQEKRKPSFSERLNTGMGRALEFGNQIMEKENQKNQIHAENEALKRMGIDAGNIRDPNLRKLVTEYGLKGKNESEKFKDEVTRNKAIIRDLEAKRNLPEGSLDAYVQDPKMAEQVSRPAKEKQPALTEKPVPPELVKAMKKIIADNPKANADELQIMMDEVGIPPVYSKPYAETRRSREELNEKRENERNQALRKETFPIREQLANKALAASQGIQNKEHLLDLIENGNIDDPTFAALAEAFPLKLGKRLLSNDTVEYKSGLIEEFGDLRNLFQGQTRIKEIELLEDKIADLYLTDEQKKAILKSRINALQADQIRAEAAQELEDQPLGVLQFNKALEEKSKPRLEALFNRILDEQKSIIQDAENKKKIPLDVSNPEDRKIMEQIKKEAGGDKQKAKDLAKKRGYIVKGAS